jgi:uncharacterized protein YecA (UPF0149 family)
MWRAPIHRKGELPWKTYLKTSRRSSEAANADTAFASETNVKRGFRSLRGGMKDLREKLGRNDLCPCGSGRKFQEMLPNFKAL